MNSQPLKVIVWNVRGLNAPARRNVVHQVVLAVNPGIVCLQETKLEVVTPEIVKHCLGNKFESFYYVPAVGTRGGVLLAWDALVVSISNRHISENAVTALV